MRKIVFWDTKIAFPRVVSAFWVIKRGALRDLRSPGNQLTRFDFCVSRVSYLTMSRMEILELGPEFHFAEIYRHPQPLVTKF